VKTIRGAIFAVIAASAFGGYAGVATAVADPCGGTGGNGQVVDVGAHDFTIKRNDGARDQVIHLAPQAAFETSSGSASLSDVKVGDRVTLVGGPNPDGSFTADTVVVCDGGMEPGKRADQARDASSPTATERRADYDRVARTIDIATILFFGLAWCAIVAVLRRMKKVGFVYLMSFSLFFVYIYKVLDYTLLRFQTLLLLQHFVPGLMLNGIPAGRTVNLIPVVMLTSGDVKSSLLNILMMVPFGFGSPFIADLRFKRVVIAGLLFSLTIELVQLITGFAANTTFRIADVNDVIFNTIGVAIGYGLFAVFVRIFRGARHSRMVMRNPILRYIAERPQLNESSKPAGHSANTKPPWTSEDTI
jgi:glycopeptide antibiotics resistance protein